MSGLTKQIENLVLNHLPDDSYFLVDVQTEEKAGKIKLVILIDSDEGITIEACAKVSRAISEELETSDLFPQAFVLEVSSPGLDFPLGSPRQYKKNVGRDLKVLLQGGSEVSGKLLEVNEEQIKLLVRKKEKGKKATEEEMTFALNEIKKSTVQVSFK